MVQQQSYDQKYYDVIQISIFFLLGSEIISYIVGILSRALYPFNYYNKMFLMLFIASHVSTNIAHPYEKSI